MSEPQQHFEKQAIDLLRGINTSLFVIMVLVSVVFVLAGCGGLLVLMR